jgi:RND family efflux transporter MFP subunit
MVLRNWWRCFCAEIEAKRIQEHMSRKNITHPYLLFFLFSLLTALFPEQSPAGPPGRGKGPPPVVAVMPVTEKEVNQPEEYVGRVEAIQAVDLRARVEGYLEQVKFREGTDVRTGNLLYLVEQAPYRAKVGQARAKVAETEAGLKNTQQYLKRLKAVRSGGVSATDLETAFNDELRAKALLQEAKANLQQAEINLGYTTIKAPISGRIGRTAFTKGNLVGPGSGALSRIVQLHPIRVVYSMSEYNLAGARHARRTGNGEDRDCRLVPTIRIPGAGVYEHKGKVDFVDNEVDPDTGTIAIRAIFNNPDGLLLPGQYVMVLVKCKVGKRLPVIPQSAVQEDRQGRYVFVVDGENRVQQRRIVTGPIINAEWVVESGLMTGETLVVQGVQKISPGQVVETVAENRKAAE